MRVDLDIAGRNRGFTLIEVMIVVAIVAILAAIAFPSYARYVEQARRADAKAALLDAAQRLERCHTQFNAYNNAACATFPVPSPDGHYEITVVRDAMTFELTATAQGVQANSPCGNFTITHLGERDVTGSLGRDRCW
jgi:type IV pilus assembly protein PilE